MAEGPGKYDDLATYVREKARADGVIVIVLGGDRGHGFSAQLPGPESRKPIAQLLRDVARQIENEGET